MHYKDFTDTDYTFQMSSLKHMNKISTVNDFVYPRGDLKL